MHPLLEKQETLYSEATELLETQLLPILNEYGNVVVGGSYVYKLLNYPDIDIDIINPKLTKELYAELCSKLIVLESVSDFDTCDRLHFPHRYPGTRPTGYWISPRINHGEYFWKIDIWLQEQKDDINNSNSYEYKLLNLDDEKRIIILSLKEELRKMNIYGVGKEFQSVDVYDAVLNKNVTTVSELKWMK